MLCPNCREDNSKWYVDRVSYSQVQDGRLKLNEISVIAYLSCETCSETLKTINEEEINNRLNLRRNS